MGLEASLGRGFFIDTEASRDLNQVSFKGRV